MHIAKGLAEVDEVDVQRGVPLHALLDYVSKGEDLIYASPASSKSCLLLSQLWVNDFINSTREESCRKLQMELTAV